MMSYTGGNTPLVKANTLMNDLATPALHSSAAIPGWPSLARPNSYRNMGKLMMVQNTIDLLCYEVIHPSHPII